MRILMTFPYTLGTPGGGTVGLLEIQRSLADQGAEVTIAAVDRGPQDWAPPPCELVSVRPSRLHRLLDAVPMAAAARRLGRFDAVIGWLTEAALLPGVARSFGATFSMVAAHPAYASFVRHPLSPKRLSDAALRTRTLRAADSVFALSEFTRDELVTTFGLDARRVVVTHWGVDAAFGHLRRAPKSECANLLFFGALTQTKGVFDAIVALGLIARRSDRPWRLRIAGWGDQERVLGVARDHGIADRIEFTGRVRHSDVPALLAWADVAMLPSYAESFGLSVAEAQAAGLPVVAYRAGAVAEVVDDGRTGRLVTPGDIESLAAAVEELLADPGCAQGLGRAGRERVTSLFRWDKTAGQMLGALSAGREPVRA